MTQHSKSTINQPLKLHYIYRPYSMTFVFSQVLALKFIRTSREKERDYSLSNKVFVLSNRVHIQIRNALYVPTIHDILLLVKHPTPHRTSVCAYGTIRLFRKSLCLLCSSTIECSQVLSFLLKQWHHSKTYSLIRNSIFRVFQTLLTQFRSYC